MWSWFIIKTLWKARQFLLYRNDECVLLPHSDVISSWQWRRSVSVVLSSRPRHEPPLVFLLALEPRLQRHSRDLFTRDGPFLPFFGPGWCRRNPERVPRHPPEAVSVVAHHRRQRRCADLSYRLSCVIYLDFWVPQQPFVRVTEWPLWLWSMHILLTTNWRL